MTEEGYKGGLVSRVRNTESGKKFLISTAQEIGKDYWCTVIHPTFFFGLIPNIFKRIFVFTRNNMEEARITHQEVKEMVANVPEKGWWDAMPDPMPPDGWSPDAVSTIERKLGR